MGAGCAPEGAVSESLPYLGTSGGDQGSRDDMAGSGSAAGSEVPSLWGTAAMPLPAGRTPSVRATVTAFDGVVEPPAGACGGRGVARDESGPGNVARETSEGGLGPSAAPGSETGLSMAESWTGAVPTGTWRFVDPPMGSGDPIGGEGGSEVLRVDTKPRRPPMARTAESPRAIVTRGSRFEVGTTGSAESSVASGVLFASTARRLGATRGRLSIVAISDPRSLRPARPLRTVSRGELNGASAACISSTLA